jgi:cytochrome P450
VQSANRYGDVVRLPMGPFRVFLARHPDHVQRVLLDNQQNYGRQTRGYRALRETLGNGLVTSDGDFWLRQRRIAQPAFHKQRIARFASVMTEAAEQLVASWEARARSGEPFDVMPDLLRATLAIIGRSMFGQDLSHRAEQIGEAVELGLARTRELIFTLVPLPAALPTRKNRRYREARETIDRIVFGMIEERRRAAAAGSGAADGGGDLLSLLMDARDELTGEGMTDVQLRDELITILVAGHETTSMALAWTFCLLSWHPAERRRLEEELAEVLGGRAPTLEDLPRLRFTRMVLEESMRLYPPAWNVARSAAADDTLGPYRIPAGSFVMLSPYVTHRHPAFWENPEGFDPDRFDPERRHERPRFAYFPFGGGPHLCIGNSFAMMEAQIVLATVAQRYRLDLVPGHPIVPLPLVTLRPRHGVKVTLKPTGR